jgi:hypothetical protein
VSDISPYFVPLTGNLLVCIFGLALAGMAMYKARGLLLLPLSVVVFLLTNGIFQGVTLLFDVGVAFPTDPLLYRRAALVHSIFVAVATIPLLALAGMRRRPDVEARVRLPASVPLGLASLALFTLAYLLLRNPELLSMSIPVYRADSYTSYIEARNATGQLLLGRTLSGLGLASLAFTFLGPAALALLQFVPSLTDARRRLLAWLMWLTMLMLALLNGSRMMLTFVIVFPLALLIQRKVDARSLTKKLRELSKTLIMTIGIVATGIIIFQIVFQSTAVLAAWLFFGRTFVAPGAVSGGYYLSFPDVFAFRGAAGIFMMPIPSDHVDFSAISIATTDLDSNANASFLATAYSALGFVGVLIVSLTLVIGAFLTDLLLLRVPRRLASSLVFANIFGIMTIANVPFRVSVATNAYIIGPLWVLLTLTFLRQLSATPSPSRARKAGRLDPAR